MSERQKLAPLGPLALILSTLTAACLGVSAYVHLDLASSFAGNPTGSISQESVFRIQGIVVIVLAFAVLAAGVLLPGRLAGLVFLSAAGAMGASLAAVIATRYWSIGEVLFLPNMDEHVWYTEKTVSAVAEGLGAVLALLGAGACFAATGYLRRPQRSVS